MACDVWDCVGFFPDGCTSLHVLFCAGRRRSRGGPLLKGKGRVPCEFSQIHWAWRVCLQYSVLWLVSTLCNVVMFLLVALCAKSVSHLKCLTLDQMPKHQGWKPHCSFAPLGRELLLAFLSVHFVTKWHAHNYSGGVIPTDVWFVLSLLYRTASTGSWGVVCVVSTV